MASEDSKLIEPSRIDSARNKAGTEDTQLWELVAEGDWLAGQRFKISGHTVLGRDSGCDITIPGTHLSRRHAELAIKGSKLLIRDLDSSNGTYVNNERITATELQPGDTIRFDVLVFRIHGPNGTEALDTNATKIRPIPSAIKKPQAPRLAPEAKNWKTKPTAVGNRDNTANISTRQKAASSLWTAMAIIVGIATLVGIGYLVTQL
ncbi:MAG: FHA domain-containing protein [Pseudomonadales bacterium]